MAIFREIRKVRAAWAPSGRFAQMLCATPPTALTHHSRGSYIAMNKPLIGVLNAGMNQYEVDLAIGRLNSALDQLFGALRQRAAAGVAQDGEMAAQDHARLVAALDESLARREALEAASLTVEARLDKLGSALRGLATGLANREQTHG
jgi:hypothetical protein